MVAISGLRVSLEATIIWPDGLLTLTRLSVQEAEPAPAIMRDSLLRVRNGLLGGQT
ncbi:hypothetical protein BaRGS_00015656, partial [Batillaria attramentaria]